MSDEEDENYKSCKVVLLGETGVGKTSIISRYITNVFSPIVMTSTSSSFVTKDIEIDKNNKVRFQIWDTAGQEKYRSLAKIFYQNSAVIVLVYDSTSEISFKGIKEYWVKQIKEHGAKDVIIAIAANKCDDYFRQVVPIEEGQKLAKELNAIFKNTSAKLGLGIDELFQLIAEKFINPAKNISETYMNNEEIKEYKNRIKIEEVKKKTNEQNNKRGCC